MTRKNDHFTLDIERTAPGGLPGNPIDPPGICGEENHMTTIIITYTLSATGQRAALRAGVSAAQRQTLTTELPDDLIEIAQIDAAGVATYDASSKWVDPYSHTGRQFDEVVTAEIALGALREDLAAMRAHEAAQAAKREIEERDSQTVIAAVREGRAHLRRGEAVYGDSFFVDLVDGAKNQRVYRTPDLDPFLAELIAEHDRVERAEAAEKTAKAATETAARERGVATLRQWAGEHGSDRVRAMIEMQIGDWQAVAEEEFLAAHTPQGYDAAAFRRSDSCAHRRKPSLPEIVELKRLRELVEASGGVLAEPLLQWHTVDAHTDEDGSDDEAEHYAATDVDVIAPTGRKLTVARVID